MSEDESESGGEGDSEGTQEIGMDASNEETVVSTDDFEGVHDNPEAVLNRIEEAVEEIGIDNPSGRNERHKAVGMQDAVDQVQAVIDQIRQQN